MILIVMLCGYIFLLIQKLLEKPSNIEYYRIKFFTYNIFCTVIYVGFFVVILYCIRCYNMPQELNLKEWYNIVKNIINLGLEISWYHTIVCIIFILLLFILILIGIVLFYRYLLKQIFNLYLFIRWNPVERDFYDTLYTKYILPGPGPWDIITYIIAKISAYLTKRLGYYKNGLIWKKKPDIFSEECKKERKILYQYLDNRPWYHFDKILRWITRRKYYKKIFVPLSPLFFIFYDCIFNNFIITHVYYYLLFFMPIMLVRRITTSLWSETSWMPELFWDILYKKETCIYALPIMEKKLFDIYVANGFRKINVDSTMLGDFDITWSMSMNARFIYDETQKCYHGAVSLEMLDDTRWVYQYTDYDTQKEVQEEWVLIKKKYYYPNPEGYITTVYKDTF